MGVKSARPSFTAFRQLAPMNKELLLKIPTTVTNLQFGKDFKKHDDELMKNNNDYYNFLSFGKPCSF